MSNDAARVESPSVASKGGDTALIAVPFRARGFSPNSSRISAWLAFIVPLVIWQAASSLGWLSPVFLPSPMAIANSLYDLTLSGTLPRHVGVSVARIGAGWAIGTATGIVIGLSMGLFTAARAVGLPLVSAIFPIPKIALLPLLILWLGIGETPKVATIALGVFFPTTIAVYTGVGAVPINLIRMAQSFEVPFLDIVRNVVLPGALPSIIGGFRISASIALLLVVAAEMIGAETGIGAFVLQAGNLMQIDQLLAGVVTLSILGLLVGKLISKLESRMLRWR